jgi:glutaredoxin
MAVLLYTRRGCHLCERAEDLLLHRGADVRLVDVDADPETRARYGLRVPVLEADGVVLLEGRFDERSLAAVWRAGGVRSPGSGVSEPEVQPPPSQGVDEADG